MTVVAPVACSASEDARLGELVVQDMTKSAFYVAPDPLPEGGPGEVIRSNVIPGGPHGATSWRVMYHSTGPSGQSSAVSAVVVASDGDPPAGGRPIVSWAIGSYTMDAYRHAYGPDGAPTSLDGVVTPAGQDVMDEVLDPIQTSEPWRTWLDQNTPGQAPIDVPMFVAQGQADTLVDPRTTDRYVARLCAAGGRVEFRRLAGVGHGTVALEAAPDVAGWFADLSSGRPASPTCTEPGR